jgi:DNA replication protein DnaC
MKNSSRHRLKFQIGLDNEVERKKRAAKEKKANANAIKYFDEIYSKPEQKNRRDLDTSQLKILVWNFGKKYFESMDRRFIVDDQNRQFLDVICRYFSNDLSFEKVTDGELRKGLFVHGPCGTGKSSIMDIIRNISRHYHLNQLWFSNVSVHTVVKQFNLEGEIVVEKYSRGTVHFDDLGTEKKAQSWGIKENLFERLLQIRYNAFKEKGTKTHVTSNIPIMSLQKIYGKQVYDRMFEMFNFIELEGKSRRY